MRFDFFGNNHPAAISWTASGASVGLLALDRNGDGRITNGFELFSNVTPQPGNAATHLGFKALAMYDRRYYGGNDDGVIDAKDAVFTKLRVWIDRNHNGVSEPGELLNMNQAGIQSIFIHYIYSNWRDQYGNRFQYRAQIKWSDPNRRNGNAQGSGGGRAQWAFDVVLLSAKGH